VGGVAGSAVDLQTDRRHHDRGRRVRHPRTPGLRSPDPLRSPPRRLFAPDVPVQVCRSSSSPSSGRPELLYRHDGQCSRVRAKPVNPASPVRASTARNHWFCVACLSRRVFQHERSRNHWLPESEVRMVKFAWLPESEVRTTLARASIARH
jgi:hypothetical protein